MLHHISLHKRGEESPDESSCFSLPVTMPKAGDAFPFVLLDSPQGRVFYGENGEIYHTALTLLESPTVGMTVRLATGEVWERYKDAWSSERSCAYLNDHFAIPLLKAAVIGGAVVSVPEIGGEA